MMHVESMCEIKEYKLVFIAEHLTITFLILYILYNTFKIPVIILLLASPACASKNEIRWFAVRNKVVSVCWVSDSASLIVRSFFFRCHVHGHISARGSLQTNVF